MGYAFISYSSENQAPADSMRALLKKNNIDSWMAPYDIPIGSKYAMVINQAVKGCSCLILLLTDYAQNSVWVAKEVERAINYRKPIIPIQLEDLVLNDEFELYISNDQIVRLPKIDESDLMNKILQTIAVYTGKSVNIPAIKEITAEDKPQPESTCNIKEVERSDFSGYQLPSPDLLDKYESQINSESSNEHIKDIGTRLISALASFDIKATLAGIDRGPRLTRYLIVPESGVRASSVMRLADDLALALAVESVVVEAPVPGRSAIGIDIPNRKADVVSMRELISRNEFLQNPSKTCVAIGKGIENSPIYADIKNMPHLLVAGGVGTGKSMFMNTLITSILFKARPDEVRFIMIDPKGVEFSIYSDIPHLAAPIITDPRKAAGALNWAVTEMNKRYDALERLEAKNIDFYNEKVTNSPELGTYMPKLIIIIDELSDLMLQMKNPIEQYIMILAQKARAAGIHLIIGTQRASADVFTGVIKANIPSRAAFKTYSGIDSRNILDQNGAEKLLSRGDMYFAYMGKPPMRIQGALISQAEIQKAVDFIKSQNGIFYDKTVIASLDTFADKRDFSTTEEATAEYSTYDVTFIDAVSLAIESGWVSISFLQRKLRIGYGKAAMLIDRMEDLGIVSKKNSTKPRKILMTMEEWNRKLDSMTD